MECEGGSKLSRESPHELKSQMSVSQRINTIWQSNAVVGYFDCELPIRASVTGQCDLSGDSGGMRILDRVADQFAYDETKRERPFGRDNATGVEGELKLVLSRLGEGGHDSIGNVS
jgi:hypothetical protein